MSTPYEFIAAPPVVAQFNLLDQAYTYWPKMDDDRYTQMSDHQIRAHARRRGQKGSDLIYETRNDEGRRVERVRCIAGLKPGIYRDSGKVFLNPALVPLIKPAVAPDPPEEFANLCGRLSQLKEDYQLKHDRLKRWQIGQEITLTRTRLVEIYKEAREVKPAGGLSAHPWRLLDMSRHLGDFPGDDHCQLFRGAQGFIWTSQPYGLSTAETIGFAHLHQLTVTVSPHWSWHCPGKSVLIEWQRKQVARLQFAGNSVTK